MYTSCSVCFWISMWCWTRSYYLGTASSSISLFLTPLWSRQVAGLCLVLCKHNRLHFKTWADTFQNKNWVDWLHAFAISSHTNWPHQTWQYSEHETIKLAASDLKYSEHETIICSRGIRPLQNSVFHESYKLYQSPQSYQAARLQEHAASPRSSEQPCHKERSSERDVEIRPIWAEV